jgi:Ca2+-binding RTX toxin-like protein
MSFVIKVAPLDHDYIGAIEWGGFVWTDTGGARDPVSIGYYLASDHGTWTSNERTAMANAFQAWANVANITFHKATSASAADLIEHNVPSSFLGGDLGLHGTPEDAAQSSNQIEDGILLGGQSHAHGYFNYQGFGWDDTDPNGGLAIGGYGYWTALHEIGHGLGLAHPHDDGGGSGIFPGVNDAFRTGSNGLNQGVWTVMSYIATQSASSANTNRTGQDAWTSGGNAIANYGYYAGPMAFDIAAIQHLYGANTTFHNGNDTYILPDSNGLGTYFTCIWDTGGNDSIRYNGSRNVTISLVAATLDNSPTGGGVISAASGIHGGFTIANGVVIENAYGGKGNDTLTGNAAANILHGGAGADIMAGGGGNDRYYVDNVGDVVIEKNGAGNHDRVVSTVSFSLAGQSIERLRLAGSGDIDGTGNSLGNTIFGNSGDNVINGKSGADHMEGRAGSHRYYVDNAGDVVIEAKGAGNDRVVSTVSFNLAGQHIEQLTLAGTGNINGTGNSLKNVITGNSGSNVLNGRAGNDTLTGGGAADVFHFNTALNAAKNVDTITDFQVNLDKIWLDDAIFAQVGTSLSASEFVVNKSGSATKAAHNIIYDTNDGWLFYDPDGNGAAARVHFATLKAGLALDHLDFVVV